MTDEELIVRLRNLSANMFQSGSWGKDLDTTKAAADRIEQLADELHTMKTGGIIEVANRNNRVTEYMFYWEGRALEAESKLEESEAKLGEYNLIWQAYDGDLHQAYVDANEARIDAEAKLSECEARLGKAVELLRKHCDIWAMNDFDAADLEALIGEKE